MNPVEAICHLHGKKAISCKWCQYYYCEDCMCPCARGTRAQIKKLMIAILSILIVYGLWKFKNG